MKINLYVKTNLKEYNDYAFPHTNRGQFTDGEEDDYVDEQKSTYFTESSGKYDSR